MSGCRYNFNLLKKHTWKDMGSKWFWKMWGVKTTLKYMILDTFRRLK